METVRIVHVNMKKNSLLLLLLAALFFSSCTRTLGYGVLLWSAEDPPVPSGTVLPVYIRSNIDNVWVVGIPREFQTEGSAIDKFEIPLAKLELSGSRRRALERAEEFAPFALSYAETLQDGLPIRENPDNGARRVYRLRLGEIVKILAPVEGVAAVGASGDPLPGEWYRVLTENGTEGFCFSYRLKLFEHSGGVLAAVVDDRQEEEDPNLERLLSRKWSPESYGTMVSNRRYDLEELSRRWSFDPGQDTGIARINVRDMDISFQYSTIRSTGTQSWRFEGTSLQMNLRSENTLAVQFTESSGLLRTLLFVALPTEVEDIILQESARRESLFQRIYDQGPVYVSSNYGTLVFQEDGRFTWIGNMLLVPQVIPASALGSGRIEMRLFLASSMSSLYSGAFTLYFDGVRGAGVAQADFMYSLDSQGFRIEYLPQTSLDGITVVRRASSPLVLYFYRSDRPEDRQPTPDMWNPFSGTSDPWRQDEDEGQDEEQGSSP